MSHTPIEELRDCVDLIRQHSSTEICIDTEGSQSRTHEINYDKDFQLGQRVQLVSVGGKSQQGAITIRPKGTVEQLVPGSILAVDFDSLLMVVTDVSRQEVTARVINHGSAQPNRAITVYPSIQTPVLSERDIDAVRIGLELGIREFALSFTGSKEDVAALRELVGPSSRIVSKIESRRGVRNLAEILNVSDAILIDRGDLSREVPLENIPLLQKSIIRRARGSNIPVYVATNLLESMRVKSNPTQAELNDVMNTLEDGATGLVLAAETAIGDRPVVAFDMLRALIERYRSSLDGYNIKELLEPTNPLLPKMHGRSSSYHPPLIVSKRTATILHHIPTVDLDTEGLLDVHQLVNGVYSPLTGFMGERELEGVLTEYRLPSGAIWTLPILFQIQRSDADKFSPGRSIGLRSPQLNKTIAVLHVHDRFSPDLDSVAHRWFGTTDRSHPGVNKFLTRGPIMVGGNVEVVSEPPNSGRFPSFTPTQARMIFTMKRWTKVVAFHTRNVPHKGHEFILKQALAQTNADGLFIHPVVGPKKKGDFTEEAVLAAYEILLEEELPEALLSGFATYSRFGGPREGVFTALCRKNFGCSHFVVGRDHTGVGNYYSSDATWKLFETIGDLGIEIVRANHIHYCHICESVVESCEHESEHQGVLAGNKVREALEKSGDVPGWLMRESISGFLLDQLARGEQIFI
jgi:ATP sulfurylase